MQGTVRVSVTAIMCGAAVFFTASAALALDSDRRFQIAGDVAKFVETVGCVEQSINPDDLLIADLGTDEYDVSTYITFPAANIGCVGGTGAGAFTPVIYRVPELRPWASYVDLWSTAKIDFVDIPSSSLETVEVLDSNRIRIVGYEHGENDANCCPSKRVDRVYRRYWERGQGLWVPEFD